MDEQLVSSIIRVCQSEYLRHSPDDALLSFLVEHNLGQWSGTSYRVLPQEKAALAAILLDKTGTDAFSELNGGSFMRGLPAIVETKYRNTASVTNDESRSPSTTIDAHTVMLRQAPGAKLLYGEYTGSLPKGMSISCSADKDLGHLVHQTIIVVRHLDHFNDFEHTLFDYSDCITPFLLYAGSNSFQQDAVARFIKRVGLPVYYAGDLSIPSLIHASRVPQVADILRPPKELFTTWLETQNHPDMFDHFFYGQERNLSTLSGPVGFWWKEVTEKRLHFTPEMYLLSHAKKQDEPAQKKDTAIDATPSAVDTNLPAVPNASNKASISGIYKKSPAKPPKTTKPAKQSLSPELLAQFEPLITEETLSAVQIKQQANSKNDKRQYKEPELFKPFCGDST